MSLEKLEARDRERDAGRLAERLMREVAGEPSELLSAAEFRQAVATAWLMGATYAANVLQRRSPCRICGCWELAACEDGCWWAEDDLCSACATDPTPIAEVTAA